MELLLAKMGTLVKTSIEDNNTVVVSRQDENNKKLMTLLNVSVDEKIDALRKELMDSLRKEGTERMTLIQSRPLESSNDEGNQSKKRRSAPTGHVGATSTPPRRLKDDDEPFPKIAGFEINAFEENATREFKKNFITDIFKQIQIEGKGDERVHDEGKGAKAMSQATALPMVIGEVMDPPGVDFEEDAPEHRNVLGVGAGRCLCSQAIREGLCVCRVATIPDAHLKANDSPFSVPSAAAAAVCRLKLGPPSGKRSSLKGSTSTGLLSTSKDTTSIGESPESDSFPWNVDVAPNLPSTIDPKFKCEVPGTHRRLGLSRSGPDNVSNTRWLEEKILAKHPLREAAAAREVTTLMMCDIPFCQTIDSIIDTINSHGFIDTFNLVYMPSSDRKYLQNLGYVFVNFKTAEYAMSFREAFQGFRWPKTLSEKMSYTKPALCQGYAENVNSYIEKRAVGCLVIYDYAVQGE